MRYRVAALLFGFPAASGLFLPPAYAQPASIALTHVSLIDGTGVATQPDMTIVTRGERIVAIGKAAEVKIPEGARVIDATGKFVIPGLWEMHGHVTDATEASLPQLVLWGVTGVRDLGGDLDKIDGWREEIARGQRLGPRIVRAGPFVDGPNPAAHRLIVTSPAAARAAVDSLKVRGVDFIKVHSSISPEAFFAVVDQARKAGLPVAGHVPRGLSSGEVSDAGVASIEHIEILLEGALFRKGATAKTWDEALAEVDDEALFARFVQNGTWLVPTLVAYYRGFVHWEGIPKKVAIRRACFAKLVDLTGALHRAGVPMLAGSDFTESSVGIQPGVDLHHELALLVEAGYTPLEAIQAATVNPARFLGTLDSLGTVQEGKLADFVVLDADPLNNINNTRAIHAVLLGGRFIPVAALREEAAKTVLGR